MRLLAAATALALAALTPARAPAAESAPAALPAAAAAAPAAESAPAALPAAPASAHPHGRPWVAFGISLGATAVGAAAIAATFAADPEGRRAGPFAFGAASIAVWEVALTLPSAGRLYARLWTHALLWSGVRLLVGNLLVLGGLAFETPPRALLWTGFAGAAVLAAGEVATAPLDVIIEDRATARATASARVLSVGALVVTPAGRPAPGVTLAFGW